MFFKSFSPTNFLGGGRPHWAKLFQVIPEYDLVPHLKHVYGERLKEFGILRDKFDPERIFLNSYMEDILYNNGYNEEESP